MLSAMRRTCASAASIKAASSFHRRSETTSAMLVDMPLIERLLL